MKASIPGGIEIQYEAKSGRWDWILLPILGFLTVVLLTVSVEAIARRLFPVSQTNLGSCFATDDPTGNSPAKPNSVCAERTAESPFPVEYRFNDRGDREDSNLAPRQQGAYRIVMIGSSFAMGLFIPREMTFAAILPKDLSRRTGRTVELYNEAKGGKFRGGAFPIKNSALRFHEALSAAPDLILWIITPMDIENSVLDDAEPKPEVVAAAAPEPGKKPSGLIDVWQKLRRSIAQGTLAGKLRNRWEQSRSAFALKHFLIASEPSSQYIASYLKNEDDAEFLKKAPNAEWQKLLQNFEDQAQQFENQARSAGVPFAAVLIPNRAQSAMISSNAWPSAYDPYRLDNELRAVIVKHGGTFIDIAPDFRSVPDAEQYYLPVDGHLNVKGQALVSQMLARELTSGSIPALGSAPGSENTAVRIP